MARASWRLYGHRCSLVSRDLDGVMAAWFILHYHCLPMPPESYSMAAAVYWCHGTQPQPLDAAECASAVLCKRAASAAGVTVWMTTDGACTILLLRWC